MSNIFLFFKYLPVLLKFKNVAEIYKDEQGKNKPAIISRRFVGAVIILIGAYLGVRYGISAEIFNIEQITEHLMSIIGSITILYGIVMTVVGYIKKSK